MLRLRTMLSSRTFTGATAADAGANDSAHSTAQSARAANLLFIASSLPGPQADSSLIYQYPGNIVSRDWKLTFHTSSRMRRMGRPASSVICPFEPT